MAITNDVNKTKEVLNVLNNTDVLSKLGIAKCDVCTGDCPGCPVAEIAKKAALDPDFAKKLSASNAPKSFGVSLKLGMKPEQYKQMAQKAKAANPGKELTAEQIVERTTEAVSNEKVEESPKQEQSKDKKETPKEEKENNPVGKVAEIFVSRKKDDDFKIKPNIMMEQAQKAASAQFNNAAELQRFHMLQRQNGIGAANQADFSLAAKAKAAADQANMLKNQTTAASTQVQGSALQQTHAKLQALINQTIQQATYIRNTISNERQEQKILVQQKNLREELPPRVTEQMKKVEKAIDTIIKHSWQQMNQREQRMFTEVKSGIKIVNSVSPETRKSPLHKDIVVQNLRSVERAMKILRSKETARAMTKDDRRVIKLRPPAAERSSARLNIQRNIERGKKVETKRSPATERPVSRKIGTQRQAMQRRGTQKQVIQKQRTQGQAQKITPQRTTKLSNPSRVATPVSARQTRQTARDVKIDTGLQTSRKTNIRVVNDRTLVRELRSTGLRGQELKAAFRAAKAELKAGTKEARVKVMRNEPTLKRKEKLETKVVQNRNVQRAVKVEAVAPKLNHKLSLKNIREQGVVPTLKVKMNLLNSQVKKIIEKSPVLSRMVKEVKKVQAVASKAVNFVKSIFSKKEKPLKSIKKILASKKTISKKDLKKLKAKMDAKELFELQMWLESVKKKKKFRVKGYENGAPRELGPQDSKDQKDFMEVEIPMDGAAPEVEEHQEQAV